MERTEVEPHHTVVYCIRLLAAKTMRRWIPLLPVVLLILFLCLATSSAQAQDALWKIYMETGSKAFTEAGAKAGKNEQEELYALAEKRFSFARKEAEKFGAEDPRLAKTFSKLALVYITQRKYVEAESLVKQSLAIWHKNPEAELSEGVTLLGSVASLYYGQGKYAEAETIYKRVLEIRDKNPNPNERELMANLNSLAYSYSKQGKYAEAERHYQRMLEIAEKMRGAEHQLVKCLINLAHNYNVQGKYAEAEPHYKRALSIEENIMGADHLYVAIIALYLARNYYSQDKYEEAEPEFQRSLKFFKKSAGPDHPDLVTGMESYAAMLRKMNREAEAAELETSARAIRAKQRKVEAPK